MVRAYTLTVCVAAMVWIAGCNQEPPPATPQSGTAPRASDSVTKPVETPRPHDPAGSGSPAEAASPSLPPSAPVASETPNNAGNLKPSTGVQGHKSVLSALGRSLLKGVGEPSAPRPLPPEAPRFDPTKP